MQEPRAQPARRDRPVSTLEPPPERTITARSLLRDSRWALGPSHFLLPALCVAPTTLVGLAAAELFGTEYEIQRPLLTLVGLFSLWLGYVCVAQLTVQNALGRDAGPWEALRATLLQLPSQLALAVAAGLTTLLGLLLLIVPGVFASLVLFSATPAMLTERVGPLTAMRRSADLTHGHRAAIFGAALAIVGAAVVCQCLPMCCITLVTAPEEQTDVPLAVQWLLFANSFVVRCTAITAIGTLSGVFYARARGLRDSIDAEAIAEELR